MFQPSHPIAKTVISAPAAIRPGELAVPARIDIGKIWSVVSSRWRVVAYTTAASIIAVLLFVAIVRHEYTATTQLLIDPSDLRIVENGLTPANQMPDAVILQVESQVRVLASDNVLRRVIIEERLYQDPEFVGGQSQLRTLVYQLLAPFGFDHTAGPNDPTLRALTELQRRVRVRRAERTYVIDVTVTSEAREKSARVANAIAQAYLAEQTAARSETARRASNSLSARLNELKDRVREAEERVEVFKSRNNLVGSGGQLVGEQQLHELNNQLTIARTRTADAKSRFEQIEHLQRSGAEVGAFTEAVQSQTLTPLRAQYGEITRREAEQTTTLGARHPAVIEIRAQVARLRRVIAEEINRIALATRSEFERARANEEALARTVEGLRRNMMTTNEALVALRELEREGQASRAVYESFLIRSRETGEQGRLDTKNVRVISKADLPLYRSWPPSNLIIGLGALIFGVGAGIGLAFLREWQDEYASSQQPIIDRPRRNADTSGETAESPQRSGGETARSPPSASLSGFPVLAVLPEIDNARRLDALEDPASRVVAEMRKIHDTVRTKHKKNVGATVLVVAPHEGDDASTVALNLALVAAAAAQRVLIIDADMQRRTLSAIVPDQTEAGLVDVAVGRKGLSGAVIQDLRTKIAVLPLFSPQSRRKGSINEDDLKSAFDQTKRYDLVIVVAQKHERNPSARFFAGLVDHIVLIIRQGEASKRDIDQLVATLIIDVRKVLGTVLIGTKAA
jgi:succinoglycan biosynthesis transport protein ExoP